MASLIPPPKPWYMPDWQWDFIAFSDHQCGLSVERYRRGPVTFYRYQINLPIPDVSWWVYIGSDFGFGIHVPDSWRAFWWKLVDLKRKLTGKNSSGL